MTGLGGAIGVALVWGRLAYLAARGAERPRATWPAVGVATCLVALMAGLAAGGAGLAAFGSAFVVSLPFWTLVDRALAHARPTDA